VVEADGGGSDIVFASVTFSLAGQFVETLTLTGNAAINGTGNGLANTITGNGAANVLTGGDGNDYLDGGAGADKLVGGAGDDYLFVDNVGDTVVELANEGYDTVQSSVTFSLAGQYVERLILTGATNINGTGNGQDNEIFGNNGANVLNGGAGNDKLHGGAGTDTLTGGAGLDGFYFDTALATMGVDNITDFNVADDTIFLARSIFTAIAVGNLAATAFVTGAAALDGDDRIIYNSTTGNISYDADGNGAGAAVVFAHVAAGTALTAADFVIF
jgi:Ca2+-binding RTX toxin-like protein